MRWPLILLVLAVVLRPFAAVAQLPDQASPSVLILPFRPLGDAQRLPWIADALQQTLAGQLGQTGSASGLLPTTRPAEIPLEPVAARQLARGATADWVLFGSYHLSQEDLRFTGQVVDVQSGRVVGTLSTTGPLRDLFALEDTLAGQLNRLVQKHAIRNERRPADEPAAPPVVRPTGPLRVSGPWEDEAFLQQAYQRMHDEEYRAAYYRYNYTWYAPYWYGYTWYSPYYYGYRSYRWYPNRTIWIHTGGVRAP